MQTTSRIALALVLALGCLHCAAPVSSSDEQQSESRADINDVSVNEVDINALDSTTSANASPTVDDDVDGDDGTAASKPKPPKKQPKEQPQQYLTFELKDVLITN